MEFREEIEDPSFTVAIAWIFLGLMCPGLWQHANHYLQDLRFMIACGADFGGLRLGRYLVWDQEGVKRMLSKSAREDDGVRDYAGTGARLGRTAPVREGSRWELFCQAISDDNSVVREQMFKAHILAELAGADTSKILPWEELEAVISTAFPSNLRDMVLDALR